MLRLTENGSIRRLVRDRIDSLARPLVEMGATTNAVHWFVWSNGKLLAQVESNGTVRVAHSDELGKMLALTDNSGVLTDEFAYQPYGRLIAHSGTTDVSFLFMGDYGVWHAGQGLYLTRHRAYDANLARFLQVDLIGLGGGLNLYAYANNNPLMFIDSLGLWGVPGAIFGGIVGGVSGGITGYTQDGWQGALGGALVGGAVGATVGIVAPQTSSTVASLGVAALTGAGASALSQQAVGMINGQSWSESASNIDWWMVGGASAGGVMGIGVNAVFTAQIPLETQIITGSGSILQGFSSVGQGMIGGSMELAGGLVGQSVKNRSK